MKTITIAILLTVAALIGLLLLNEAYKECAKSGHVEIGMRGRRSLPVCVR